MSTSAPRIREAHAVRTPGDPHIGTRAGWTVWTTWDGVDRPATHGFAVGDRTDLRDRLIRAIEAGAVFYDAHVREDVNGQTYVEARSRVLGRYLNADLRRLGF